MQGSSQTLSTQLQGEQSSCDEIRGKATERRGFGADSTTANQEKQQDTPLNATTAAAGAAVISWHQGMVYPGVSMIYPGSPMDGLSRV